MTAEPGPDDPDDDPMLKSMRSVWLDMREQDPPERGLAELMAAAHTQATAMKPAEQDAWWRRSFAFLMRPPMLAAAAVVVMIGGAVALKGRGGTNAELPTMESGLKQRAEERVPSLDGVTRDLSVAKNEKADREDDAPVTAPTGRGEAMGSGSAAPPVKTNKVLRPTEKQLLPPTQGHDDQFGGVKDTVTPPPPPPPPPKPDPESGLLIAGEGKGQDATDVKTDKKPAVDKGPAGQQRPEPPKPDAAEPTVESTGAVKDGRATGSTDQLVKQAETAASRNDCPAVRATVARIKKAAPDTYKSKVATQPAIARCLK